MSLLGRLFPDLRGMGAYAVRGDLAAAITVMFMAVPQGVAYATIAELPPATGLFAAAIPTIVSALARSSRHVVAGPTNALSLLVGGALAVQLDADPVAVGVTLAVMVGVFQLAAGVLRLGAIVDYVSQPVVLGYITGAGVLIGVGQLPNLTATPGARGHLLHRMAVWVEGLTGTSTLAIAMGLGTAAAVLLLRRINRKLPAAMIAMAAATAVSWGMGLEALGLRVVRDIHPVPVGLPPLTLPSLDLVASLVPLAGAATVLSLIESTAVARAIAARTGDRLDISREFTGQGLSNLAAGFFGGYPVSGSLSRSALNEQAGAVTRMSGVYTGVLMVLVLLFLGPAVDRTPVAALAGLLLVVAWDLVDRARILTTLKSTWADRVTLVATIIGTWSLPLDQAIYLGVTLSMIFFLRQARLLTMRELVVDTDGHLHELDPDRDDDEGPSEVPETLPGVRIFNVQGHLFFAVEAELRAQLDAAAHDPTMRVLVLRMRRALGMDVTVARVLEEAARRLRENDGALLLAGVDPRVHQMLRDMGAADVIGEENILPPQGRWFAALEKAIRRASVVTGEPLPEPDAAHGDDRARLHLG